jgi:hypothetical protein
LEGQWVTEAVANVTNSDWSNVSCHLIDGKPGSFGSGLHDSQREAYESNKVLQAHCGSCDLFAGIVGTKREIKFHVNKTKRIQLLVSGIQLDGGAEKRIELVFEYQR